MNLTSDSMYIQGCIQNLFIYLFFFGGGNLILHIIICSCSDIGTHVYLVLLIIYLESRENIDLSYYSFLSGRGYAKLGGESKCPVPSPVYITDNLTNQ